MQALSWVVTLLPIPTLGLAGWVPTAVAACRVPSDRPDAVSRRLRLGLYAAAYLVAIVLAAWLLGLGETREGASDGPLSDVGGFGMLAVVIVSTVHAVRIRKQVFGLPERRPMNIPEHMADLPGVGEGLARRQLREQYRELAHRDRALAREIGVGHPERKRTFTDGGLIDLNGLTVELLKKHGSGLSDIDVEQIDTTRRKLGRLASVDEIVVHGEMPHDRAEHLREYAVFL